MRKYIIVTGGVLSGLGKGIAAASMGNLLTSTYKVVPIKCDGYLNVDPGTMNPVEHGEVFVLDDGAEVDMDFGHYERFLGTTCDGSLNLTMGKVFQAIRNKERRGDYLGKTVQFMPHVAEYIRDYYIQVGNDNNADVVLIEVGGTVGDIENELYIEAVKRLGKKVGSENILYAHLTYVPIPTGVDEQKTKPTQQSVAMLKQKGIQPDIIIARCETMLSESVKEKIAQFCDVEPEAIVTGIDVDSVYKIPVIFEEQGMSKLISDKLKIPVHPNLTEWKQRLENMATAKKEVTIAIAGKYTELEDSYASVVESLKHAGAHHKTNIQIEWIATSQGNIQDKLKEVDGVIVPGGFGTRGTEGKIEVIKYCRENNIPFLGICYGLQLAVIEFARHVCGLPNANSTEINPDTKEPVVNILEDQKKITELGGTMRLGAYSADLLPGSIVSKLYNCTTASERHRHRYEVNPKYHEILKKQGLVFSGLSPDGTLAEFIELPDHPYFVATQAHPELKSSLIKPAPLFDGLVKAAVMGKEEVPEITKTV
jgi:CTP synthase